MQSWLRASARLLFACLPHTGSPKFARLACSVSFETAKAPLREALLHALQQELDTLVHAHAETQRAATHEEAKPENDKDTRALEQSYLARGQALRVEELRSAVAEVATMQLRPWSANQPIALGALVTVVSLEDDKQLQLFLAPAGGGVRLDGARVQVVTPHSPYGRALLGKREGDSFELELGGKLREFEVLQVQ